MNKIHKPKAAKLVLFGRAFKESIKNIWRNKVLSLATITVITILMLILNILFTVNTQAKESLKEFGQQVDMILYLKDNVEYHTVKNILDDLGKIDGVSETNYTSKKDAIDKLATNYPKVKDFFEKFEVENPLPESINIKTEHPDIHSKVLKFIDSSRYKDMFDNTVATKEDGKLTSGVALALEQITDFTEQILYFVLAAFIIGGILIIQNAIKLTIYARRKEIEVMKLVGASRFFIKLPYILEGIWYFAIAVILNFILWGILIDTLAITSLISKVNILLVELGAGILISIISGSLASTKHLNA